MIFYRFLLLNLLLFLSFSSIAQYLDFSAATIYCPEKKQEVVQKAIEVLQEEIQKRSGIQLKIVRKLPQNPGPLIAIGLAQDLSKFPQPFQEAAHTLPATGPEGYQLAVMKEDEAILIAGHDPRGVLYGVGKLLRKMEIREGQILVPEAMAISSSPQYPIRGHQLGYRPKTNAYDAWTVAQYDQYIRDLAIFGANSIEIMPPRTDDDFTSVHMKMPAIEMIAEQSRICNAYGMDVWMWYPNMSTDYQHPDSLQKELEERHEVFSAVPRLDALFVPGGDPGDLEPDVLFDWLAQVAEVLHQYHPDAKIWVSPQVFRPTQAWFDVFYERVNQQYPWFGGVVFGPWIKTPIQEIRRIVHPEIPIRRYPDITHSLSAQYPVPHWDLAYAITLGRECINPRPQDEKMIHNAFDEYAQGSLSYSEGTNDDVNKFVWSDQDWNPETPVIETLRDYARFFIGPDYTETVAQGLMALEKNIQGPLLTNKQVPLTLQQWQAMEKNASDEVLSNFRFQMGLIRAYFDAYVQRRLLYETELEQQARDGLTEPQKMGNLQAMNKAQKILTQKFPFAQAYKIRCLALADSLFHSIGAQLTIEKHGAMGGRGNFIDNLDAPLNDAVWLMARMQEIAKINGETERAEAIEKMLHRTDPGPGGFYDNFGSPESWSRVVIHKTWEEDPGSLQSPRVSFGAGIRGKEWVHEITATGFAGHAIPLAWTHQVTTLYDLPLEIVYDNLNPQSSYTLRVAYTGRFRSKMKLMADDTMLIHDFIQTGEQPIYEFPIPAEALQDGVVKFSWTCGEGERGAQVAEIWIIQNADKTVSP